MFYIVYKIINNINGKYYIGCHQTSDINDGYYGSGKHLKHAIKKYGKQNFTKLILYVFDNAEQMFLTEQTLVNEAFVRDPQSYNLKVGGSGGNPGIVGAFSGRKHSEETKEKLRQKAKEQIISEAKRQKLSANNWSRRNPEEQRKHASKIASVSKSESHRKKISESIQSYLADAHKAGLPHYNLGKKRQQIECPHCKRLGGINGMKQWHFDKCKAKGL